MDTPNTNAAPESTQADRDKEQQDGQEQASARQVRDLHGRIDVDLTDEQRGELAALILGGAKDANKATESLNKAWGSGR